MIAYLLRVGALFVYCAWVLSAIGLKLRWRHPVLRWCYHEFKPLYWPALAVVYLPRILAGDIDFVNAFGIAGGIANWFFYHDIDDDDDRWHRRLHKLRERVAALGGRLTVVADGTS